MGSLRRYGRIALVVLALGAGIVAVRFFFTEGQRLERKVGAHGQCSEAGILVIAHERKSVYSCYWTDADADAYGCFALVDGDAFDVTSRLDEVDATDEHLIFRCTPSP